MKTLLIAVLFAFIAWDIGWGAAHVTVAAECKYSGRFMVGTKVYGCREITRPYSTGES